MGYYYGIALGCRHWEARTEPAGKAVEGSREVIRRWNQVGHLVIVMIGSMQPDILLDINRSDSLRSWKFTH